MAKVEKKAIIERLSKYDDDEHLSLMEDVTDSWDDTGTIDVSVYETQIEELNGKIADLTKRYKDRFLSSVDEKKIDENEDIETVTKYVDVREV